MAHHVDLDLPLSAKYASTVRAAAASLAAIVGLSINEIDDLRLGVNEAISVLTDLDPDEYDADTARLRVRFDTEPDRIGVVVSRTGVSEDVELDIDVLARKILTAVVDEFGIDAGAITLSKRISADART